MDARAEEDRMYRSFLEHKQWLMAMAESAEDTDDPDVRTMRTTPEDQRE